jgi:hypothetical protein
MLPILRETTDLSTHFIGLCIMHARTIRPHNQNNCRISSDLRS